MDILTKTGGTFQAVLKSTSAQTKSPTGSFEAWLSVPVKDRDGEVVDPGAFNPLPDHLTIDIDHAMTVEKTVASGTPFYVGERLKFEGTYASHPLAQMVRSLVDEGHIRTMSVAYMNPVYEIDEKDGLPHLRSAELLNAGIVGIPANREALITASKSLRLAGGSTALELETLGRAADRGRGLKSVVGSYEERQAQLRNLIAPLYPTGWVFVRATFDDSVVFDVEHEDMSTATFQAPYTRADDGELELGTPAEVGLAEVVIAPKSPTSTNPEHKTAADEAAVKSPAEVDVAKARVAALAARAALELNPS